jgi:GNAT superfamily N-acetyltransferase
MTHFLAGRLAGSDVRAIAPAGAGISLIRSGLLDSLALVDFLLWIEGQCGVPLDEAGIDHIKRADTLGAIVDFVLAGGRPAPPDPRADGEAHASAGPFEGVVVAYRPELRAEVLALQVHHWGGDRDSNDRYLQWKYEQNPYQAEPLIFLACVAGRAVGMRGFYGSEWEAAPGQRLRMVCAGDLVVHPAYRNRGVVSALMRYAGADLTSRGAPYLLSLSAGPVTRVASLAQGWRGIGSLEPVVRRRRGRASRGGPFDRLDGAGGHRAGPVAVESPDPAGLAELVARLGHDGRLRHVRTPEYFAWRLANPRSAYRVLTWREKRLEGYLVLAAPTRGRRRVRIVDWEASTASIRAALLRAAIDRGDFDEVLTWSATLPDDARGILREAGFAEARPSSRLRLVAQPTLLLKDLAAIGSASSPWEWNGRSVLDRERWDLRILYSDGV